MHVIEAVDVQTLDMGGRTFDVAAGTGADDFDEAFRPLFLRGMRLAYRMLGDAAAAEDVAADAMVIAYARWDRVRGLSHRDAWILRVVGNLALKAARSARRQRVFEEPSATPDQDPVLRIALVEALRALPRRQRDVVVLRYLAGLSEPEVAAALGVSLGTVKTHARRALASLRTSLVDIREEFGHADA
jgi:RNA polymerase sigma-70 factor (sigma-E family)